jgi:TRAP-type C4-dicarboxylate transport system permease small subunit
MKVFKIFDYALAHTEEILSAMCMLAMTFVVTIAVLFRWLGIQFISSDELARYLMIWSIYIGIIIVTRQRAHVAVDLLPNVLRGVARKILLIFIQLCVLGTLVWLLKLSLGLTALAGRSGQASPILKIPYWFMYSSMTVGFGLSIVRQLQVFYHDFISSKKPTESELIDEAVSEGMVSE